jgi:hypothetical protein
MISTRWPELANELEAPDTGSPKSRGDLVGISNESHHLVHAHVETGAPRMHYTFMEF